MQMLTTAPHPLVPLPRQATLRVLLTRANGVPRCRGALRLCPSVARRDASLRGAAALPRAHDGAAPSRRPSVRSRRRVALSAQVRRVLTTARNLGIRMEFTLTRLPAALRTPGTWLEFKGRSVQVRSDGTCVPVRRSRWIGRWAPSWASKMAPYWARGRGEGACTPSEAQLAQPPPRLLSSLLLPYPAPLLEGDGTELHCSS